MTEVEDLELLLELTPEGPAATTASEPLEQEPFEQPACPRRRRGWIVRRSLLAADLLGLALAFSVAQLAFGRSDGTIDRVGLVDEASLFLLSLPVWVSVAKLHGLYDRDEERTDHSTVDDVVGVFHLVTLGAWLFFAGTWLTGLAEPNLPRLAAFWALAIGLVTVGRAVARAFCRRSASYRQNTVIVGAGRVGRLVARKLRQHPEYGMNLAGFVDVARVAEEDGPQLLGTVDELATILREHEIERVVIAFPWQSDERTLELIRLLRYFPVQVDVVPRFFQVLSPNVDVHTVEGLPLIGMRPCRRSRSSQLLKRTADLAGSTLALVLLAPLFAVVAVAIRLDSPGPVFFRQLRMGRDERTFHIYKFRTMVPDADAIKSWLAHLNMHRGPGGDPRMFKIPDDPRVTRVGRFLRRYSLDELPQFINVLKGEMSLVGPRPLILDEDNYVRHWARRRGSCLPGITGPWQVLGRSTIPFEEMISLDYLYVTERSLSGDLKWIARTLPALFRVRDAY